MAKGLTLNDVYEDLQTADEYAGNDYSYRMHDGKLYADIWSADGTEIELVVQVGIILEHVRNPDLKAIQAAY